MKSRASEDRVSTLNKAAKLRLVELIDSIKSDEAQITLCEVLKSQLMELKKRQPAAKASRAKRIRLEEEAQKKLQVEEERERKQKEEEEREARLREMENNKGEGMVWNSHTKEYQTINDDSWRDE